jgi:hypothetical protein
MKTNTLILLGGAAAVAVYFMTRKKEPAVAGAAAPSQGLIDRLLSRPPPGPSPRLQEMSSKARQHELIKEGISAIPGIISSVGNLFTSPAAAAATTKGGTLQGMGGFDGCACEMGAFEGHSPPGGMRGTMRSIGAYGGLEGVLFGGY